MNCRDAQNRILADRADAGDAAGHGALAAHLATCAGCRQVQADLAHALAAWQSDTASVTVPDVDREWQAVRRQIRGGETGAARTPRSPRSLLAWLALPLGAAAAAALALFISPGTRSYFDPPPVAQVDSVETPGNNASTLVFVDEKSGWLIVWASDASPAGD